jgi:hypothetical protein
LGTHWAHQQGAASVSEVRFQVFVSSTFLDLREERAEVAQAIQELGHIPAGMELFPASNEEHLTFIKRVIDESDYYIVIVAGRYGSMTAEGISYTEKEFDYATECGVPTLAFLHDDVGSIRSDRSERHQTFARSSMSSDRSCKRAES